MQLNREIFVLIADVVLKDKIIVYDLARRRLGWDKRDCKIIYPHKLFFAFPFPLDYLV